MLESEAIKTFLTKEKGRGKEKLQNSKRQKIPILKLQVT